eukprot:TRINITY_DN32179_c0_g1_i1.p1 TRINITY_DN32179_c0_g1~~TRINITY_DN32179_c0_g1_i1.p1  ORF type:complete len:111 (-),score=20.01 TRINITY_DN32179_c0_g1_i1:162-494(-)
MTPPRQQRPHRSASLLCLAVAALLWGGPAFLPGRNAVLSHTEAVSAGSAAASLVLSPLAAHAQAEVVADVADDFPIPVLGVFLLSVIVVIVLLISGVSIGRGLVETIDDL